ncbi:MAG: hypothetical protein AB9873_12160 [Syntrophobacteraceae bacterium]
MSLIDFLAREIIAMEDLLALMADSKGEIDNPVELGQSLGESLINNQRRQFYELAAKLEVATGGLIVVHIDRFSQAITRVEVRSVAAA